MRMSRLNVYVPDDLAEEARAAELNISRITQEALRVALAARRSASWLSKVRKLTPAGVRHDQVMEVLDTLRAEEGDEWPARASRSRDG
jgi:post-segregation antitoxin (ccd killing protein)